MPGRSTENWSGQQLTPQPEGQWTATRTFIVVGTGDEAEVLDAAPEDGAAHAIPAIDDPHPANRFMLCRSTPISRRGVDVWEVRAEYAVPPDGTWNPTEGGDPLRQPPVIAWSSGQMTMPTDRDIYGRPIVNSARDAFDPPPNRTIKIKHLTITRNEPFYNFAFLCSFENTVNSKDITCGGVTFKAGDMYCSSIQPEGPYSALNSSYVRMVYSFDIFNDYRMEGTNLVRLEDPWQWYVKDAGRRAWGSYSGTLKQGELYRSDNGQQIDQDVPLDGTGKPLPSGQYEVCRDGSTRVAPASLTSGTNPPAPWPSSYIQSWSTADVKFLKFPLIRAMDFLLLKL